MKIDKLNNRDIGRWVEYAPRFGGSSEVGRIKSWNDEWVFVVYHCDNKWDEFKNYTAAATSPKDLRHISKKAALERCGI